MNIDAESPVKFIFFVEIVTYGTLYGTGRIARTRILLFVKDRLHIHSERVSGSTRSFVTFILGPDSKRRLSRFIDRKRGQRAP